MYNKNRLGHHLAKSSVWSLGGQFVSTITTLMFFALLGRTLPPTSVGTYMLIMNVIMVTSILGTYGIQATVIRKIATDLGANKQKEVKTTTITGIVIVTVLSLLIGVILGGPVGDIVLKRLFDIETNSILMILIGSWLTMNCIHVITTEILRGFHDIKHATIYGASTKNTVLIILVSTAFLFHGDMSIEIVILAMSLALFLAATLALKQLNKHLNITDTATSIYSLSKSTTTFLFTQSTPIFFTSLLYQLVTRSGIFVLGYFATKNELALYGASLQMVVIILIPLRILNSVLPPIISSMYFNDVDHSRLEKTVRSVTTIATIPSLTMIIFLVFFGEQLLELTYGPYYGAGYLLIIILAIGSLSDVAFGPAGFTLVMTGHQTVHLRIIASTGFLAVVLAIMGGLIWGILGVACMAALSTIIQNLTAMYFAHKKTGVLCCTYLSPGQLLGVFTGIKSLSKSLQRK